MYMYSREKVVDSIVMDGFALYTCMCTGRKITLAVAMDGIPQGSLIHKRE